MREPIEVSTSNVGQPQIYQSGRDDPLQLGN